MANLVWVGFNYGPNGRKGHVTPLPNARVFGSVEEALECLNGESVGFPVNHVRVDGGPAFETLGAVQEFKEWASRQ